MKEHPFLFTQDEKEGGGDNKEENNKKQKKPQWQCAAVWEFQRGQFSYRLGVGVTKTNPSVAESKLSADYSDVPASLVLIDKRRFFFLSYIKSRQTARAHRRGCLRVIAVMNAQYKEMPFAYKWWHDDN